MTRQAFLIAVTVCTLSGVLLAGEVTSQKMLSDYRVTLNAENAALSEILEKIEAQTKFTFSYFEGLDNTLTIDITANNKRLDKVLETLAIEAQVNFRRINGLIAVNKPDLSKPLVKDLSSSSEASAQEDFTISGKITDENGQPLPGANIIIKGTTLGTTADAEGNYALTVPDGTTTLVFSYIGYATEEVDIVGRSIIDMMMLPDIETLQEVVVSTGYWDVEAKYNPGNIAKVSAKDIEGQAISNPLQAIQGRMAGVYVRQTTGVPGGGFRIQIRGQNSLRSDGNEPFYIVDGVPYTSTSLNSAFTSAVKQNGNPLSSIHPDDIENIQILKDADATAIYGSRGANGVVLITTKRPESGKVRLNIDLSRGVGEVSNKANLMNKEAFLEMNRETIANDGLENRFPPSTLERFFPAVYVWDQERSTDWQEELLGGTAQQTTGNISLSGGSTNTTFLIGGGYFRETTVFPGDSDFERFSGRFSFNHASVDGKLQASASTNYTVSNSTLPNIDFTSLALTLAPNAPALFDEEGNLNWENGSWENPLAALEREYIDQTNNLVTNATISYELLKGLRFKSTLGYNVLTVNETSIQPLAALNPETITPDRTGASWFGNANTQTWIVEPQLSYQTQLLKGELNVLLGTTLQSTVLERETLFATGFSSDALLLNIQAANEILIRGLDYSEYRYNAVFGRIQYAWEDKYLLNLTGRRDGSTRFGPRKQFGNFGAVGAAWIFSEENFVQDALPFLSFGKLRASYGATGNDQIGDYQYLDSYTAADNEPYNGGRGLVVTRLANADFSWETVKKLEAGLEFGLLNDKVYTKISWYRNRSTDQLVGQPLSLVTGASSIQFNLPATVENRGWEFEINTTNVHKKNFQWTTGFNLTIPENELIEFPDIENFPAFASRWEVGKPIIGSSRKMLQFTGLNPETGAYDFVDFDGDGRITNQDQQKFTEVGQEFFGGIQNTLRYKGFQLDFLFQFVKQTQTSAFRVFGTPGRMNQPSVLIDRWRQPGDMATFQQATIIGASAAFSNYRGSDQIIVDGSFIRLGNVSLSYSLPKALLTKLHLENLKIFVEGQNLLTITEYQVLDPEVASFTLPPLRIMTGGIQLTL